MPRRPFLFALLAAGTIACGSPEQAPAGPPAPTPTRASASATPAPAPAPAPADEVDAIAAKRAFDATRAALLQQVLDGPELTRYLHLELEERTPVRVLRNHVVADRPPLTRAGPVVYVEPADAGRGGPLLEFTGVTLETDAALVELRYPIEGVRGTITFRKTDERWGVADEDLVEE
jgi:hypothetical protein